MIYLILRMSSGGTHSLVTAPCQHVRSPSAGTAKGPPPSQRTGLFILIWHKVQGLKGNFHTRTHTHPPRLLNEQS